MALKTRAISKYNVAVNEQSGKVGNVRYFQKGGGKLVPEGVSASVPCKGPVADVLFQLCGGLRSGMGYTGSKDIAALHHAEFVRISPATVRENHPHDLASIQAAPNYNG